MKLSVQFVLPLLGKVSGTNDEATFDVTTHDKLLHKKSCHDGFSGTGVIGKHEAQRLPWEHLLIYRRYLMGQRFNGGSMHSKVRIK